MAANECEEDKRHAWEFFFAKLRSIVCSSSAEVITNGRRRRRSTGRRRSELSINARIIIIIKIHPILLHLRSSCGHG